eukprot:GHVU01178642.1.p1 GENE.GHVU01178642.1~~GHVU01178642.1.p1  ORF type:complete len:110 (+),score=1.88 GHVU01178642.1:15-344(+)
MPVCRQACMCVRTYVRTNVCMPVSECAPHPTLTMAAETGAISVGVLHCRSRSSTVVPVSQSVSQSGAWGRVVYRREREDGRQSPWQSRPGGEREIEIRQTDDTHSLTHY